jgi:hypothetical protein
MDGPAINKAISVGLTVVLIGYVLWNMIGPLKTIF